MNRKEALQRADTLLLEQPARQVIADLIQTSVILQSTVLDQKRQLEASRARAEA